jgi:hypothetical protein
MQLTAGSITNKRQFMGLAMILVFLVVVWNTAGWIITGKDQQLILYGLAAVIGVLVVYIMKDWRTGVLLFFLWLLFEDLARKYVNNNMVVYFGKDFLLTVAYLSYYLTRRHRRMELFKLPFLVPIGLFFFLALIQVFNTWSPSVLYGILGMKLYFFYIPLAYLGYAMMERPSDLNRFLLINVVAGSVIAALGVVQSVLGIDFLTPDDLAPELVALTRLNRYSPVTHSLSAATTSVFVSTGRYSAFLVLLWILTLGTMGYLLLCREKGAIYCVVGVGLATLAAINSGTRTPVVFIGASALIMASAFIWGVPWGFGYGTRMLKTVRRAFLVSAVGLLIMTTYFPEAISGHWAFVSETLSFGGQGSELQGRAVDYPMENLLKAFQHERWLIGYGTGTNSLGLQYVSRLLDQPPVNIGVESGYGMLVVEMGILGLVLWFVWSGAVLFYAWKTVRQLRDTVYFPIAFAIWWYAFVLLVLLPYLTASYQNFVMCAYLWILIGILFRMPKLAEMSNPAPATNRVVAMESWQVATSGRRV